jgi:hypothetical protein
MTSKRRESRELDLYPEQWQALESMRTVLDHDELEETVQTLIELGAKAISITDREHRYIKMVRGTPKEIGDQCKTCGRKQLAYEQEVGVMIAAEERSKKDVRSGEED